MGPIKMPGTFFLLLGHLSHIFHSLLCDRRAAGPGRVSVLKTEEKAEEDRGNVYAGKASLPQDFPSDFHFDLVYQNYIVCPIKVAF